MDSHREVGEQHPPYEHTLEEKMGEIRAHRAKLLTQSDWTQSSDSPLSSSQKAPWGTYRQQLRDLPGSIDETNIDNYFLDGEIVSENWPLQPS